MTKDEKQLIIGVEIKKARCTKNLTQVDLANKAGISRTYLSDLENEDTCRVLKLYQI